MERASARSAGVFVRPGGPSEAKPGGGASPGGKPRPGGAPTVVVDGGGGGGGLSHISQRGMPAALSNVHTAHDQRLIIRGGVGTEIGSWVTASTGSGFIWR